MIVPQKKLLSVIAYIIEVFKISKKFIDNTVEDLLKAKFGDKIGDKIVAEIDKCKAASGIELVECVVKNLAYSTSMEKEIWDFLYHFVIVG